MNDTEKNEETSFCTVTRLMALADDYAALHSNWVSGNTSQTTPHLVEAARQALQDELTKLFTPLSDDEVGRIGGGECRAEDGIDPKLFAKEIEAAHGIGETK